MSKLPIHFFTIVLNGKPFIDFHIEVFNKLKIPWHWHIVEGMASLSHDTAWSVPLGGRITQALHQNGLSIDGTTAYIDKIKSLYPENITVYRKPAGSFWDGKQEMISLPLTNIKENCLLWEIDVDELWTADQIHRMHCMFTERPDKTSAWFWCWYFVGPEKIISSRHCYAQNPNQEWNRVWRYSPGMYWVSHEPPVLAQPSAQNNGYQNVGLINPFSHAETEANGLVFEHYSYVTEQQLAFKENYYGYSGAVAAWHRLQKAQEPVIKLRNYFPWVKDETEVSDIKQYNLAPLASYNALNNCWQFMNENSNPNKNKFPEEQGPIIIDGVFFQYASSGIARYWQALLQNWSEKGFGKRLLILDRNGTAPKIAGLKYHRLPAFKSGNNAEEQQLLQQICEETQASLFVSTYYSRPANYKTFQLAYDMIPEVFGFNFQEDEWSDKKSAFEKADFFASISENTKKDLIKFYSPKNPSDIQVVYPAADQNVFKPANISEILDFHEKYNITLPYFMLVGARTDYKNVQLAVEALQKLNIQHGLEIVLVGSRLDNKYVSELKLGCKINLVNLDDNMLKAAYSGAVALIYPSLYEGFGLPILEALSCNCPVITTPFSSIPEAAGIAALYASNSQELADALCEVQKPSVRQRLTREASLQVAKFSWDKSAQQLEKLLSNAAAGKQLNVPEDAIKVRQLKKSDLDNIIPPEVYNDEFYNQIIELCQTQKLTHVLEIGSSSGAGSTQAFVKGLSSNPAGTQHTRLYCLELSQPRFEALNKTYSNFDFVKCYNLSSVPLEAFPDRSEVSEFYHKYKTGLNKYPLDQVLGWLSQDIDYINDSGVTTHGIRQVKQINNITDFDMVLIDGSEFTGKAEMKEVYGAKWLLLDDICVFKNYENYHQLKNDENYELYYENQQVRNGFAIFRSKSDKFRSLL